MKKIVLLLSSILVLNLFSAHAQVYRDGFTNDYNAPVAQHWGGASGLTVSHLASSSVITVVGNGTSGAYATLSYTPYDNPQMAGIGSYTGASGAAITSFDMGTSRMVYAVIRSTVTIPLTLQLKDVNNYVTSAGAPTYVQSIGTSATVIAWDLTGANDGGYGSACTTAPCTIDFSQIKEFIFQINAGVGNYSGTMVFDYIQVGGTAPSLPTVSIATPSNGASITALPLSLTASATAGTGTIDSVAYFNSTTKIGASATGTSYSYSWGSPSNGSHLLTAVVYNHLGITNNSAVTSITVSCTAVTLTPSFTASVSGLTATLTGATTGGTPASYDWNFGDASTHATTANASRTYTSANTYTVTYTVYDACGNPYTASNPVTVSGTCTATVLTPTFTSSTSGLTATLTGATTGGTPASYDWDFGDASTHTTTASASRTYASANTYTVTYKVYDACNNPYTVSHPVTVSAPATGISAAQANIASSKVYPNPTSDMATVALELRAASEVKVTLSDIMGKEVMTIANGTMTSLNESFSVANLHKGIYTVSYFINGSAAKAEMLMVK